MEIFRQRGCVLEDSSPLPAAAHWWWMTARPPPTAPPAYSFWYKDLISIIICHLGRCSAFNNQPQQSIFKMWVLLKFSFCTFSVHGNGVMKTKVVETIILISKSQGSSSFPFHLCQIPKKLVWDIPKLMMQQSKMYPLTMILPFLWPDGKFILIF